MRGMTSCVAVGRVVDDPQASYLPSGTVVANWSVAVNTGKEEKDVGFFDCRAYGKTAELVASFVRKGSPLVIQGSLQQDRWEKDGQRREKVTILVQHVVFLDKLDKKRDAGQEES